MVGLACEHFCYAAARRERLVKFHQLDLEKEKHFKKKRDLKNPQLSGIEFRVKTPEEIPIYFLNQFDPGYFAKLCKLREQNKLEFDWDSLAAVLTCSYLLEEDDLHKGNFGFYLVRRDGKLVVVFFKIDNDLMFSDSLMSHYDARLVNWRLGSRAFDITEQDLIGFPKLFNSKNHYWPTSKRYLANPIDNKVYSSAEEIEAFVRLADNEDFQKAKWRQFYKQILVPPGVLTESLTQPFDKDSPEDRAKRALVLNAAVARQARLRAVLFSIPEFRDFVYEFGKDEEKVGALRGEILEDVEGDFRHEIRNNMTFYRSLCKPPNLDGSKSNPNAFVKGDTPLHAAIRLGDYRDHETRWFFGKFAEQRNKDGEKPLDLAVAMAKRTNPNTVADVRKDPFFMIHSLVKAGVSKTESYNKTFPPDKKTIELYDVHSRYTDKACDVNSSEELINLLRDIGEDYRYSLKMKKEIAVAVVRKYISENRPDSKLGRDPEFESILKDLKNALNGKEATPEEKKIHRAPELRYIRQLRSHLWLIRQLRGLLGGTATQVELNGLIDNELRRFNPSCFSSILTFFCCGAQDTKNDEEDIPMQALKTPSSS